MKGSKNLDAIESEVVRIYMNVNGKKQLTGFLLTLLFGPLGLIYSSKLSMLFLTSIAVINPTLITVSSVWISSMILSLVFIDTYNDRLRKNIMDIV